MRDCANKYLKTSYLFAQIHLGCSLPRHTAPPKVEKD